MTVLQRLGRRLRDLRIDAGLTQEQAAKRSRLNVIHISKLENGRANATVETLEALARVYGVELRELFK